MAIALETRIDPATGKPMKDAPKTRASKKNDIFGNAKDRKPAADAARPPGTADVAIGGGVVPTRGSLAREEGFSGDPGIARAIIGANQQRAQGVVRGATTQGLGQGFHGQQQSRNQQQAAIVGANRAGSATKFGQLGLQGLLAQGALGRGPSAAQAQFQSGLDQNIAAQAALAGRQRGASATGALRNASRAGEGLALQSNAQAAALRAQEQQAAQGLLSNQLGQTRGQDLQQAGLIGALTGQARGQDQNLIGLGLQSRGLDDAATQNANQNLLQEQALGAQGTQAFNQQNIQEILGRLGVDTDMDRNAIARKQQEQQLLNTIIGGSFNAAGGIAGAAVGA